MTHLRILALALVLSGCEETAAPPQAAPEPAEPAPTPTTQEVEEAPAPPESSPPARKPPASRIAAPVVPSSPPTVAVVPGSKGRTQTPPAEDETELRPLDLSLPEELLEAVEPGESLQLEPVLPSLFGHDIKRDYRLNGRLIESDNGEHLVEGAELRLEIRR